MAFQVGSGDIPGSTSYASVADYRQVVGGLGVDGADLTSVADSVIEGHLESATSFVDMLPWGGSSKHRDNTPRLALPRVGMSVRKDNPHFDTGHTFDDDEIPWVVIHAVCLLAEEERASGRILWRPYRDRSAVLTSKKSIVGSVKTFADPLAPRTYPRAEVLLRGLHGNGQGLVTGRRALPL